jgi:hypothetical protein
MLRSASLHLSPHLSPLSLPLSFSRLILPSLSQFSTSSSGHTQEGFRRLKLHSNLLKAAESLGECDATKQKLLCGVGPRSWGDILTVLSSGYRAPTHIQSLAIPRILRGVNVFLVSPSLSPSLSLSVSLSRLISLAYG